MAIENVGPGGVGNNYGVRETVARERYELDKEYIEEYTDVEGAVVTGKSDPVTGGVTKIINVETFAETAPISEKSLVFVQADETNDGKMTAYFHNGQKLFWLPSVEV